MARYQLRLAYDGTEFFGFQRQGNTRTVQSVFESVLRELGWEEESILFAGRTDTGVHALGQVVTFALDWRHKDELLVRAINAKLPKDTAADRLTRIEADFHPRYDASSRRYVYHIYQTPERDPLQDRYAWHIWPELDVDRLNEAAALMLGRHDFSAFGRAMKPGATTIREVLTSQWSRQDHRLEYEIEGNAFLYHMVRRTVYLLVQCARQKLTLNEIEQSVKDCTTLKSGLAPAKGLVLTEVRYPEKKQVQIENSEILDDIA
jgi:tRNA pseudouridine38-40 synthase